MTSKERRIAELEAFAAEEGMALPWPATVIAEMEAKGDLVDLATGLVVPNGAERRVSLTVVGEAVALVVRAWGLV